MRSLSGDGIDEACEQRSSDDRSFDFVCLDAPGDLQYAISNLFPRGATKIERLRLTDPTRKFGGGDIPYDWDELLIPRQSHAKLLLHVGGMAGGSAGKEEYPRAGSEIRPDAPGPVRTWLEGG